MLRIIETGPLNTIQDRGRFGSRRFGFGVMGPMDPVSFALGNMLAGNTVEDAGIEIQTYPFAVEPAVAMRLAVTGGGAVTLDDVALPAFWSGRVGAGQVLRVVQGRHGARSYLCVGGGIDVPLVLGSRSTQLSVDLGGFCGRALAEGDELVRLRDDIGYIGLPDCGLTLPMLDVASPVAQAGADVTIRAMPGAEYALLEPDTRAAFWSQNWTISRYSNRAGYRLEGQALTIDPSLEMRSHGIVPGVVQLPPAGQPIVQMVDGNTAGGYPKIAHVIDADLWRLGQAAPKAIIRFIECTHEEAIQAADDLSAYIEKMRMTLERVFAITRGRR